MVCTTCLGTAFFSSKISVNPMSSDIDNDMASLLGKLSRIYIYNHIVKKFETKIFGTKRSSNIVL